LAEIYSIALSKSNSDLGNFKKQVFFVVLGLVIMFFLAFIDYHNFRSFGNYLYIIGFFLLSGVLFWGTTVKGTTGWYDLGFVSLQPVEFAKIILIIFLAKYFSSNSVKLKPFRHLLVSGTVSLVYILLVLRQPDFGSALILFAIWGAMIFFAGFNLRYIYFIVFILIMVFVLGWLLFFKPYQKQRILTFFNPTIEDSLGGGYNITQAIIAVGSGGLFGRGIGFGSQSQLKFLPEAQTDFIFAVIAEELGLLGVFLVISFFCIFFLRLGAIIRKANDDFAIYFLLGVIFLIFVEMFVNIAMNIGLLPVVGISLPFLSYGGSVIISTFILVGIAQSINIRNYFKH
jgi:rod shape determining protein RodA